MKKKIFITLVAIWIICFCYQISHTWIIFNMEVFVNEDKYMKIMELVRRELYIPKENYECVYIYIWNDDRITIDWVNYSYELEGVMYKEGLIQTPEAKEKYKDQLEEVVYKQSKDLGDYIELREAIVDVLGEDFMQLHFAFDQSGRISAKIPFKKVIYDKKDIEDGNYYKETAIYELHYMETGFIKDSFTENWIQCFDSNMWKKDWHFWVRSCL